MSRGLGGLERFLSSAGFDRGPWLTVAFGAGIAAWFGLTGFAQWTALLAACVALATIAVVPWLEPLELPYLRKAILVLPLLVALGCATVWARSTMIGVPAIERPIAGTFTARILTIEHQPAQERDRLVLAMREPGTGRAIKVRLNAPALEQTQNLAAGDLIHFKARLMPPAAPLLPGAYDFARTAWFSGLSATGSATGAINVVEHGAGDSQILATLRDALARHVRAQMRPAEAGIATAFVTGDRGGISQSDADAMRDAGLAHLLSISGLHVSALIGAVYFLAMRLLALSPWLALRLRLPIVAAALGALAGVGYTILTGSEVPTVRSCVGSLLVLGALAAGREPLSLRMLATAAFCVMLLWPEAVTGPSFQMSFGAVLAIVALSGAGPIRKFLAPREEGLAMRGLRHVGLLLLTGVVIELALMPIGLYHFHRAGAYGALANVIAIPLSTFVVMPLVALALILDLAGIGAPVWWLAEQSISFMLALAHWFAARPGAVNRLPAAGTAAFLLFLGGGLWLGLWSGRMRLLGLVPAGVGAGLLALAPAPDVLISGDGRHVGLVTANGERLFVLRDGGPGYARDNLLEVAGMEGEPVTLDTWPGARCNRDFCTLTIQREARDWRLLIGKGRDAVPERALAASCDRVDLVISDRWLPQSCKPGWLKIDRNLLGRTGGLSIRLADSQVRSVADTQGEHPWWRPAAVRPRPPRPKPLASKPKGRD
nr:ComEC/Rec2 family competence protein [Novosphingobium sp. Rr 2-17]